MWWHDSISSQWVVNLNFPLRNSFDLNAYKYIVRLR